ncbi:hypothetical protein Ddye_009449 [Dipteronia dyeriana]|uniref:Glycosyltransferase n=1 Tax=Dipteronia dyeriana TaxID=168575 RepID=A0AAE0CM95_9ROSI|nr:hypothetical protein Ddye_009449 [Dipteronia dyeriana]
MKESIVMYPTTSSHHMVSMVELSNLILKHHPNYSIIIILPSTSTTPSNTTTINPSISFHFLPPLPSSTTQETAFQSITLNFNNVPHALKTISLTFKILCFITSSTGFHKTNTNTNNTFPTYTYFSSCASALAAILHLPILHHQTTLSFKDFPPNSLLNIPGLPPIKPSFMPQPLLDRHQPAYDFFLDFTASLLCSDGIIVNTFDSLEPQAIKAIANGDCVGRDAVTPPLYCIGPLIVDSKDRDGHVDYDHVSSSSCLTWLDAQPSRSVVLLCFGSKSAGSFSAQQLKEIATGLERSNERFLWVVKNPPDTNTEVELESILPEGFLERNKEKGMVVKSWAAQADILRHDSVGGFVTHCGWNSVVEGVSNGVPMIAWPLCAEQLMNSVVMVEEMKVAIPITNRLGEEDLLVRAEEVEKKMRELMGVEGNGLRETCLKMREMGMAAWNCNGGGSSFTAFSNLVASWNNHSSTKVTSAENSTFSI